MGYAVVLPFTTTSTSLYFPLASRCLLGGSRGSREPFLSFPWKVSADHARTPLLTRDACWPTHVHDVQEKRPR